MLCYIIMIIEDLTIKYGSGPTFRVEIRQIFQPIWLKNFFSCLHSLQQAHGKGGCCITYHIILWYHTTLPHYHTIGTSIPPPSVFLSASLEAVV